MIAFNSVLHITCFFNLGGPHSVIVADWLLSSSVLCRMGFAVLLGKSICECDVLSCVTPAQRLTIRGKGDLCVNEDDMLSPAQVSDPDKERYLLYIILATSRCFTD